MKKALIILLIVFRSNIAAQTTGILGIDFFGESLPNILCLLATEKKKKPILFYLIVSKNLCFRHKKNIVEIKFFSREISYRASYNYKIENNNCLDNICFVVNDFSLRNLELTHDHVYDLLSISYGKEYKVKGSSIKWYKRINIGFAINFPGEFYYDYLWIHPINIKKARSLSKWLSFSGYNHICNFTVYNQYFKHVNNTETKSYYNAVFKSTSSYQWAVNILIGLIENIFVEYSLIVPICHFIILYPLHIHISIGTILGTIEWLYRYFKEEDKRGFLGYFYFIFFLNSISVFKIGYYE